MFEIGRLSIDIEREFDIDRLKMIEIDRFSLDIER